MESLLLISILIASVVIPARATRIRDPQRALRAAVVRMIAFMAFYVFALRFIYPRLLAG